MPTLNIIIVGTIGPGLNIDSDKVFVNNGDGAHKYYMGLLEGLGWEHDDDEEDEQSISNFLSDLEDENLFWLEYGITEDGKLWQPSIDA